MKEEMKNVEVVETVESEEVKETKMKDFGSKVVNGAKKLHLDKVAKGVALAGVGLFAYALGAKKSKKGSNSEDNVEAIDVEYSETDSEN